MDKERAPVGGPVRRWIDVAVFFLVLAGVIWLVPRVSPRSPIAIVVICVMAVLAMKLVEHRIRQLFRRWAERQATKPPR